MKLVKNQQKFTLRYSLNNFFKRIHDKNFAFYNKTSSVNVKIINRIKHSRHLNREVYDFVTYHDKVLFNSKLFKKLFINYSLQSPTYLIKFTSAKVNNIFDINFLKKEKIYTKLKYSRVPQYDAVSGGSAAILAGFLGYLITEKFGLELLDSGDFWFFFMYVVFLFFSCYPLLRIVSNFEFNWSSLSYKWGYFFYAQLLMFVFNFFLHYFKIIFINCKFWITKWK